MHHCMCTDYDSLSISLDICESDIRERISQYKDMKKHFTQIAQRAYDPYIEHYRLSVCESCGQYWQASISSTVEMSFYMYKVPELDRNKWLSKHYVSPCEIWFYNQCMSNYLNQPFTFSKSLCGVAECSQKAVKNTGKCKDHLIQELQHMGTLPKRPERRYYEPYSESQLIL